MLITTHPKSRGHYVSGFSTTRYQNAKELCTFITSKVWTACIWAGSYRDENAYRASFYCVLDFDENVTKEKAKELFKDYKFILGPTKSDGLAKKTPKGDVLPPCDRFRVILPWDYPIHDLDVYKYNMKEIASKYGADTKACDGARIWQPCKSIEHAQFIGSPINSIKAIPFSEKKENKAKKYEAIQDYFKKTSSFPGYVMDMLAGRVKHGDINDKLFKVCCHLFNRGMSYNEVTELLYKVPILREHEHLTTTIKSAAKTTGAV